jgi:hypothetical protein
MSYHGQQRWIVLSGLMWRGRYHVPGTSGFDDAEGPMVGGVRVESTGLDPLLDMIAR